MVIIFNYHAKIIQSNGKDKKKAGIFTKENTRHIGSRIELLIKMKLRMT